MSRYMHIYALFSYFRRRWSTSRGARRLARTLLRQQLRWCVRSCTRNWVLCRATASRSLPSPTRGPPSLSMSSPRVTFTPPTRSISCSTDTGAHKLFTFCRRVVTLFEGVLCSYYSKRFIFFRANYYYVAGSNFHNFASSIC